MLSQVLSIRGATTIEENTPEQIATRSVELIAEIINKNGLEDKERFEVSDCIITTTGDITAFYPARAIRESGIIDTALFSALEPPIENSLKLCIRVMLRVNNYGERTKPNHAYLHGAKNLRKDLTDKESK
ncbi:MAG: chorismate mutase [Clostridia bacterium]|nr:chorismate mutase [Clostridia bacterium]